jgi:hypothetical protein
MIIPESRVGRQLSEDELELLEDVLLPELLSPARFFLLPLLKSVSYQPPPFKRKAGADTRFFSVFW